MRVKGWSHLCTVYHLCTISHLWTVLYIDNKLYIDETFLYIDQKKSLSIDEILYIDEISKNFLRQHVFVLEWYERSKCTETGFTKVQKLIQLIVLDN